MAAARPVFFRSAAGFRAWLERHHATHREFLVGFWKVGTGQPTMTWPESVDEALSFGWIDGVRRSHDAERYLIRFTPRKARSRWSAVNRRKAEALIAAGRMAPAGLRAWEARPAVEDAGYSFETRGEVRLPAALERTFRADAKAWAGFQAMPPGYRRTALHWVASARRDETRSRRLAELMADSASGKYIKPLRTTRPKGTDMSFQAYLDSIEAKTGHTPPDFRKAAKKAGVLKPGLKATEFVAWLARDFALGRGHAMALWAVFKEEGWVEGPPK